MGIHNYVWETSGHLVHSLPGDLSEASLNAAYDICLGTSLGELARMSAVALEEGIEPLAYIDRHLSELDDEDKALLVRLVRDRDMYQGYVDRNVAIAKLAHVHRNKHVMDEVSVLRNRLHETNDPELQTDLLKEISEKNQFLRSGCA